MEHLSLILSLSATVLGSLTKRNDEWEEVQESFLSFCSNIQVRGSEKRLPLPNFNFLGSISVLQLSFHVLMLFQKSFFFLSFTSKFNGKDLGKASLALLTKVLAFRISLLSSFPKNFSFEASSLQEVYQNLCEDEPYTYSRDPLIQRYSTLPISVLFGKLSSISHGKGGEEILTFCRKSLESESDIYREFLLRQAQLAYNDLLLLSKFSPSSNGMTGSTHTQRQKKIITFISNLKKNQKNQKILFFYSPSLYFSPQALSFLSSSSVASTFPFSSSISTPHFSSRAERLSNLEDSDLVNTFSFAGISQFLSVEDERSLLEFDSISSQWNEVVPEDGRVSKENREYIQNQIDRLTQSIDSTSTYASQLNRLRLTQAQYEENLKTLQASVSASTPESHTQKNQEIRDLLTKKAVIDQMIERFIEEPQEGTDENHQLLAKKIKQLKQNRGNPPPAEAIAAISGASVPTSPSTSASPLPYPSFSDFIKDKIKVFNNKDPYDTTSNLLDFLPDPVIFFPDLKKKFLPYFVDESTRIARSIIEKYHGEKTHFSMLFSREYFAFLAQVEDEKRIREGKSPSDPHEDSQDKPKDLSEDDLLYEEYERLEREHYSSLACLKNFIPDYPILSSPTRLESYEKSQDETSQLILSELKGTSSTSASSSASTLAAASFTHFRLNNYNRILNNFYNTKSNKLKDFLEEILTLEKNKYNGKFYIIFRLFFYIFFDILNIFLIFEKKNFNEKKFFIEFQNSLLKIQKSQKNQNFDIKSQNFNIENQKTEKLISLLNERRQEVFAGVAGKIEKFFIFKPNNFVNSRLNSFCRDTLGCEFSSSLRPFLPLT